VRLLLVVLAALVAGVLPPALGATPASAVPSDASTGLGIRLVDVPTTAADDPRARSYIVDHLRPGATIQRRVEVVNGTAKPVRVSVYPAAAGVSKDGFVGAAGHTQNDVASWTTVEPATLGLAAREKALVKVTVRVPSQAVEGENYGVIWAETTTGSTKAGGVTQVSRVGVRQYLSVGPGGAPRSDFDIVSLTAARDSADTPVVQAAVHNTGKRALDLTGTLMLSQGPGGLSAGPFTIPVASTLGIGDTEPVQAKLDQQIPDGPWLAKVTITSGTTKRTAQAKLTFPAQPGTGAAQPAQSPLHLTWWMATGAAAVLLAALLLTRRVLRRRTEKGSR
jgi:hypothetical protein